MRRTLFAIVALATIAGGPLAPDRAEALSFPVAVGLPAAIPETAAAESIAWRCTNFWNGRAHRWSRCFWVPRSIYGHHGRLGSRLGYGRWHYRNRLWR